MTLIERLKQARKLRTSEEVTQFDLALAEVDESREEVPVGELLAVFDDATEQMEVMYGLLHLVESYPRDQFLTALAHATPSMLSTAREWFQIFHFRLLNDEETRRAYRPALQGLPAASRKTVVDFLQDLAKDAPEFADRIRELVDEPREG